jgi:flagellar biosynthesis protein FliQ
MGRLSELTADSTGLRWFAGDVQCVIATTTRLSVSAILLSLIICLLSSVTACNENTMTLPKEVATEGKPAVSPSGTYILSVALQHEEGIPWLRCQVLDRDGELIYTIPETFDARHTTYFLWDQEDRVWVYSGDVGTFFWQRTSADHTGWEKQAYAASTLPAPAFLKQMRPKWHLK